MSRNFKIVLMNKGSVNVQVESNQVGSYKRNGYAIIEEEVKESSMLNEFKVDELEGFADLLGVELKGVRKKADIIKKIEEAADTSAIEAIIGKKE